MSLELLETTTLHSSQQPDYDVLIIGAGLTGLHQLHALRTAGFNARILEAGGGVGGTWYWNRYPGARLDSESYTYAYAWSPELLQEWDWSETFVAQPELERYFNYVADRFDLLRHISFDTAVTSATYDESARIWQVSTASGSQISCRFLVTAVGILSDPKMPETPGLETFSGKWYHTARWPQMPVDFAGKKVAVIGTGASGVQSITEIAKTADSLTVLQRDAQWCVPLRNDPLDPEFQGSLRRSYPEMFARLGATYSGFLHTFDQRSSFDLSDQERLEFYERQWAKQGFSKFLGVFADVMRDLKANKLYQDFVEKKIRERIDDPRVADRLIPTSHPFGSKRVPCESGYYEVYNQSNVELVSLQEEPITEYVPVGIRTLARTIEADIIVFATGFNAYRGALDRISFSGPSGQTLFEKWLDGPVTYLGLQTPGFPNLFTEVAPHNKGGHCNIPRCSEQNVEWVTRLLVYMRDNNLTKIEADEQASEEWTEHVLETVAPTLLPYGNSYLFGASQPGRRKVFLGYIGYIADFRERCDKVAEAGYVGFHFD
jgi:cation diffusion facilitator CzcD-associated flavoprotein CzcO